MSLLAELKARLVPGASIETRFPGSVCHGNLQTSQNPPRTVVRKVFCVRPTFVVFESEKTPGAPGSRLEWPNAGCLQRVGRDEIAVASEPGGSPFVTYRFLPSGAVAMT